jgi:tetratricopeptide (TPR) repeat protein
MAPGLKLAFRSHAGLLIRAMAARWAAWMAIALSVSRVSAAQPADSSPAVAAERSRVGHVPVTCPCCGGELEALVVARTNTLGGVDRDLFARALGPQPVFYRVSSCPRCCYSGYLEDFQPGVSLPPDFISQLTGAENPLRPRMQLDAATPQRDIPALLRYELAYECYRRLQRSDEALAWLCLRASWVIREESSYPPPVKGLERMVTYARRWLPPDAPEANLADRELTMCTSLAAAIGESYFNIYQRPYAELTLAMVLRRHGENAPAEHLLAGLLEQQELPDELVAFTRRMRDSIELERHWQGLGVRHFSHALHMRTVAPANEPAALYLLGELHRRLGEPTQAVEFFDRALASPDLPPDLRAWAAAQKSAALAVR